MKQEKCMNQSFLGSEMRQKRVYQVPNTFKVRLTDDMLEGFPVHWSEGNEGDIEAKTNDLDFDDLGNQGNGGQFYDLWSEGDN